MGVDIEKLFSLADEEVNDCKKSGADLSSNIAAQIGLIIGGLGKKGIDKLTFIISPEFKYLGAWLEQLIAESTGKIGKGILPVDLESITEPEFYSSDRLFVYLKFKGDSIYDDKVDKIRKAGLPMIELEVEDKLELGKQYFLWEFATAVAGWVLQIQPFDQPNVEQAKVVARQMMKEYQEKGKLPELIPTLEDKGIKIYGNVKSKSVDDILTAFLSDCKSGKNYVAIQAYLNPTKEITESLQELRTKIQKKYKVATTLDSGFQDFFIQRDSFTKEMQAMDILSSLFLL